MGEKALTLAHLEGSFSAMVRAPWPPIECPDMERRPSFPTEKWDSRKEGSSSVMYVYMQ